MFRYVLVGDRDRIPNERIGVERKRAVEQSQLPADKCRTFEGHLPINHGRRKVCRVDAQAAIGKVCRSIVGRREERIHKPKLRVWFRDNNGGALRLIEKPDRDKLAAKIGWVIPVVRCIACSMGKAELQGTKNTGSQKSGMRLRGQA